MKNVGVFFGGKNTEHDISIITAQLIISGLKGLDYHVVPIYLNKKGEWLIGDKLGSLKYFRSSSQKINDSGFKKYFLDLENSSGQIVFKKKGSFTKDIVVDLAFPAFHGPNGEDGTIQGLFEMFGVPYVGCGVAASAMAMDKDLTKKIFNANSIPTTKFQSFTSFEWAEQREKILKDLANLSLPFFVKPVHLGSSIGISKVTDMKNLADKIDVAFFYDNKVLVEEGVQNLMDITCCIIGNDKPIASLLQESKFQSDLFSFEEKYLQDGGGQFGKAEQSIIIPAPLDETTTRELQELSKQIFKTFNCSGIARVDFLYDKSAKKYYANEINPLPGTLYQHLWEKSGISLAELIEKLIKYADDKHEVQNKINHSFESSVLQNINSLKLNK